MYLLDIFANIRSLLSHRSISNSTLHLRTLGDHTRFTAGIDRFIVFLKSLEPNLFRLFATILLIFYFNFIVRCRFPTLHFLAQPDDVDEYLWMPLNPQKQWLLMAICTGEARSGLSIFHDPHHRLMLESILNLLTYLCNTRLSSCRWGSMDTTSTSHAHKRNRNWLQLAKLPRYFGNLKGKSPKLRT